jgi:hypothetical protein
MAPLGPTCQFSLWDTFSELLDGQVGALAATMATAAWGAVQGLLFARVASPTIAGPGLLDAAAYVSSILQAGDQTAANAAAARGIYGMLLPGMGNVMNPLVDSMITMGGQGALPDSGSSGSGSGSGSGGGRGDPWELDPDPDDPH